MAHAPKLISETFQPVRPRFAIFHARKLNEKSVTQSRKGTKTDRMVRIDLVSELR